MAKHLYCVISRDNADVDPPADRAFLVPYRDIALVARESAPVDYASLPRDVLVKHLADHQSLIELLAAHCTAIPIKFGTAAADDGEIREILESGYPSLKKAVEIMADKVEMDLLALWSDLDSTLKDLGRKEEIRAFRKSMDPSSPDKYREMAVEAGRMVKAALDEESARTRDEILLDLREKFIEMRLREIFDERMLMNAALLIEREDVRVLHERLEKMDERYGDRINFRVIGPLPPHSFCTLEISRIGAEELEEARQLVGVDAGAGKDEIRKAYRKRLRLYHPDKNANDPEAQKIFERFNHAYNALSDSHEIIGGNGAILIRVVR